MKKPFSCKLRQIGSVFKHLELIAAAVKLSHRRRYAPFFKANDKNHYNMAHFGPILETKVLLESPHHMLSKEFIFKIRLDKWLTIRRFF